jgi:hypothetical protein
MGCKNISPVCFYISTRVNVSFLVSSYFIPNLPLLTIVNGPTLFKSFAPPVSPYETPLPYSQPSISVKNKKH